MHERYSLPEMADRFTTLAQWQAARQVELAAVRAQASLGLIPEADGKIVLTQTPLVTAEIVDEIADQESRSDHDVAAFVDVMQRHINNPASRWFHYGLTSADVTDTALCFRLTGAADLLIEVAQDLLKTLCNRAREFAETPTAGRTHGQHAEVITFGARIANWAELVNRALVNLHMARDEIAVGKLSGACGTYTNIDPRVEHMVCAELGLEPIMATQVIPRDLHANLIYAATRLSNAIGVVALNVRIMASTEFGEVEEARRPEQKGSSAMPHKRNPIRSEQLDGLARAMHGYLFSTLEQVELLLERDISHSAPERFTLSDALSLVYYMTVTMDRVFGKLVVKPERMQLNIDRGLGLMFTQTLLTTMIDQGFERNPAYQLVKGWSAQVMEEQWHLRKLVELSPDVDFTAEELDRIFDQNRMLEHIPEIIARLPA